MATSADIRKVPLPMLVAADVLAFVVFVLIGLRQHRDASTLATIAKNLLPILAAWFGVGALTGLYRRQGIQTLLVTWAIALPIGLAARTVWVGHPTQVSKILTFFAVAMAFTLLFLFVARLLAAFVSRLIWSNGP